MSFSCEKWAKHTDDSVTTYYSKDFKTTNNVYLGVASSELDELYFHFYEDEDKSDAYKFVGEVDGDYVYHEGTYSKTGNLVEFIPDDSSQPSFDGEFSENGKILTINYPGVNETRVQVSFIFKKKEFDYSCGC